MFVLARGMLLLIRISLPVEMRTLVLEGRMSSGSLKALFKTLGDLGVFHAVLQVCF